MKKGIKIVTIGGGSSYTPELIEGFIKRTDRLKIDELWLVDILEGEEKLNIITDLARRMFTKAGLETKVYKTLDRREALVDADFVTTQFRVGQLDARVVDERIPNNHKLLGQETNGIGGMFKALRTIPVVLDIVRDVEELCPDAFIINFTNPAGIVAEAVNTHTNFKRFIAVCNVPIHMKFDLADAMNMDFDDLEIDFLGLNHMVFGLDVYNKDEIITREAVEAFLTANITMNNITGEQWNYRFVKTLNLLVCPYHRYFYKYNDMLNDQLVKFSKNMTRAEEVMAYEKTLFKKYMDVNLSEKPTELENRGGAHYSDVACDVIASIHNDEGKVHTVNIKNNGHVTNLDVNDTIEITCKMTRNGAIALNHINYMPRTVRGLYELYKSYEIAVVEAAMSQDYNKTLLAMNLSPFTRGDDLNEQILDEMLAHPINRYNLIGYEKK